MKVNFGIFVPVIQAFGMCSEGKSRNDRSWGYCHNLLHLHFSLFLWQKNYSCYCPDLTCDLHFRPATKPLLHWSKWSAAPIKKLMQWQWQKAFSHSMGLTSINTEMAKAFHVFAVLTQNTIIIIPWARIGC